MSGGIEHRVTKLMAELEIMRVEANAQRAEIAALRARASKRLASRATAGFHRARSLAGRVVRRKLDYPLPVDPVYQHWVRTWDTVNETSRKFLAGRIAELAHQPLVSVILPVFDAPEPYLRAALDSVVGQIYPHWELCIADDCSSAAWVPKVLDAYADRHPRVRVARRAENGHISAASNTALEMATGEWVALLDHDDVLAEHALSLAVLALENVPEAGLLYSDEDKIDEHERRLQPFFKPDFDPVLLLSQNYICHMTMARLDLVREVGGFREGLEGAQDWDLVLRLSERLQRDQVVHVPHILYHWREHPRSTSVSMSSKPYATTAQRRAVADHLDRLGKPAQVTANGADGLIRVKWSMPADAPKVSIIIPTRDGKLLERCLNSILSGTGYPDFEVIVVDNGSISLRTRTLLRRHERWIQVVRDERPFNFAALNNAAVQRATGSVVCLMNDDCEVVSYEWLEEMVTQLLQDGVGAVGAKLLYPDGRIQHAGVLLGVGGIAGHAHRMSDRHSLHHFGWLYTPRTLSAVTAACMVVRRDAFEELDGLDETNLGISLNDVDFCLRLREAGWRVVWTPFAVLTHHESVSRGIDSVVRPEEHELERAYMRGRWSIDLISDPAYNPNLTLDPAGEHFALASPPRLPWWS